MSIGSLGDIVFETSADKVRTIDNVKRKASARWATHEVVGKKPVREFIGPGLETISCTMQFSTFLGLKPAEELQKLRELRDSGKAVEFILGGSPVAVDSLWTLDDIAENLKRFDGTGNVIFAEVDLTLTEYPKDEAGSTGNKNSEATEQTEGAEVSE